MSRRTESFRSESQTMYSTDCTGSFKRLAVHGPFRRRRFRPDVHVGLETRRNYVIVKPVHGLPVDPLKLRTLVSGPVQQTRQRPTEEDRPHAIPPQHAPLALRRPLVVDGHGQRPCRRSLHGAVDRRRDLLGLHRSAALRGRHRRLPANCVLQETACPVAGCRESDSSRIPLHRRLRRRRISPCSRMHRSERDLAAIEQREQSQMPRPRLAQLRPGPRLPSAGASGR
jgi:hypothetical protein